MRRGSLQLIRRQTQTVEKEDDQYAELTDDGIEMEITTGAAHLRKQIS